MEVLFGTQPASFKEHRMCTGQMGRRTMGRGGYEWVSFARGSDSASGVPAVNEGARAVTPKAYGRNTHVTLDVLKYVKG